MLAAVLVVTWFGCGFGCALLWVRRRAVREIRAVLGRGQSDELAEITADRILGF